jgi:hypothetical protein
MPKNQYQPKNDPEPQKIRHFARRVMAGVGNQQLDYIENLEKITEKQFAAATDAIEQLLKPSTIL